MKQSYFWNACVSLALWVHENVYSFEVENPEVIITIPVVDEVEGISTTRRHRITEAERVNHPEAIAYPLAVSPYRQARSLVKKIHRNRIPIFSMLSLAILVIAIPTGMALSNPTVEETVLAVPTENLKVAETPATATTTAEPQGRVARGKRLRRRAGKRKHYIESGNPEVEPEDQDFIFDNGKGWDEYDDYEDEYENQYRVYDFNDDGRDGEGFHKYNDRRTMRKQGTDLKPMNVGNDTPLRRAVDKAKKRVIVARKADIEKFIKDVHAKFSAPQKLDTQAFKPSQLAAGVYKIFAGEQYLCTGTHVGNRMYVVLHCLQDDTSIQYRAVNHVHTLMMDVTKFVMVNAEIGYFPINGIKSPFNTRSFKVLEDSQIVTVYGFGHGGDSVPDAIVGFASPLGWCNAATRNGDCTAPVLDVNGRIVGLWTHGNGRDFGRFEPITAKFLEQCADNGDVPLHNGIAFRPCPPS